MMDYGLLVTAYLAPIISVITMLINLLQIYVIVKLRGKKHLTVSKIYILNLSISDAAVSFMFIFMKCLHWIGKYSYDNKNDGLEQIRRFIFGCFVQISVFSSTFNLIALTVDRYLAICKPLRHRLFTQKIAKRIGIAIWLISTAIITTIYLVLYFKVPDKLKWSRIPIPILIYFSLIIFAYCYYKIVMVMKKRNMVFGRNLASDQSDINTSKKIKLRKEESLILKIAILNVCLFTICWLPYTARVILGVMKIKNDMVTKTAFLLMLANSLLDPIIYMFAMRKQIVSKGVFCFKRSQVQDETINVYTTKNQVI